MTKPATARLLKDFSIDTSSNNIKQKSLCCCRAIFELTCFFNYDIITLEKRGGFVKKKMLIITPLLGVIMLLCIIIYTFSKISFFETMAITFGTAFYHFAMRLAVGYSIKWMFAKKGMNYFLWWFKPHKLEKKLFKLLKVRKWRNRVPTYSPEEFDLESKGYEGLVRATCQSEIVHEVIVVLSFLPILGGIWFDAWAVFIITSILAAALDSIFVILQRFNRPKLLRLMQKR